jgi:hypothetical protein
MRDHRHELQHFRWSVALCKSEIALRLVCPPKASCSVLPRNCRCTCGSIRHAPGIATAQERLQSIHFSVLRARVSIARSPRAVRRGRIPNNPSFYSSAGRALAAVAESAWHPPASFCPLIECALTLPSSGPAYGGPLKSNVSALSRMRGPASSLRVRSTAACAPSLQVTRNAPSAASLSALDVGAGRVIRTQFTRGAGRPSRFAGGRRTVASQLRPSRSAAGA